MSYINLMASDVWSEQDITNRARAIVDSQVSEARQNDLRTIMLGHIAGMRTATAAEMREIKQVQALVEQSALDTAEARTDAAQLDTVLALESALDRLASEPLDNAFYPVTDANGVTTQAQSPAALQDIAQRLEAERVVSTISVDTLALYNLRLPTPTPEPEQATAP